MIDQSILDAIGVGIVRIDTQQRIAEANSRSREVLGAVLTGRHFTTAFRDPMVIGLIEATISGGPGGTIQVPRRRDGEQYWLNVSVSALGQQGAMITLQDVTAERVASQARSEFVANVSHELRTPITAIAGLIETLQGPAGTDAAARESFLEMMAVEADRMNRLVADLLTLSQAESDDRSRYQSLEISTTIRAAVSSLSDFASECGTRIVIEGEDAPNMIRGNADQLRQVFNNLIENALKYGTRGSVVHIQIGQLAEQSVLGRAGIQVDITDQGEGIAQSHIARLTERFYRVDSHRSRETGGTGLGLSIVKHIIQAHGGTLRIRSTLGQGSTFTVFLPAMQTGQKS